MLASSAHVLIAGGGSAGHVQPALAVADALAALDPTVRITFLGTERGLETRLVPARGYRLELIPEVKFTRRPNLELLTIPSKLRRTVKVTRKVLQDNAIDAVVGFGGYVALPAYLAARHRVPIVVHEANARAGIANKVGARLADLVLAAVPDSGLRGARVIGNPVRRELADLDRAALRAQARRHFGLDPDRPTLVVIGGSLGAVVFNTVFAAAAPRLAAAGIQVLHNRGRGKTIDLPPTAAGAGGPDGGAARYVAVEFIDRMDLAYAAADLVVARSGAMTVAEVSAVGLPAVYVPLAFGNGEQALNAQPAVDRGAARIIAESALTVDAVSDQVIPLLADPVALAAMSRAAAGGQDTHADEVLARVALAVARKHRAGAAR